MDNIEEISEAPVEEITEAPIEHPKFSGKLQSIFSDGTIQYDDQIGLPSEFPLTEAELQEVNNP
jgi:hypothetical protein